MTFGLPRTRRLGSRGEFLRIQREGQRVTTAHFVLIVARSVLAPDEPGRLGVTASKQVGNAVVRARCRRLVREAFRLDPGLVPAGVDLVVIAKTGASELGLPDVQREWGAVRRVLGRKATDVRNKPA